MFPGVERSRRDRSNFLIPVVFDMSSTYLGLHYHVVFSTKHREPLIKRDWLPELHDYMGGIIRGLKGTPRYVGGVSDHVHLLFDLNATHTLSEIMRELKKASSTWCRGQRGGKDFVWQEGYSAFTVSATALGAVGSYILNQEEHHRTKSFREELIELLEKAGVHYDPKYLD